VHCCKPQSCFARLSSCPLDTTPSDDPSSRAESWAVCLASPTLPQPLMCDCSCATMEQADTTFPQSTLRACCEGACGHMTCVCQMPDKTPGKHGLAESSGQGHNACIAPLNLPFCHASTLTRLPSRRQSAQRTHSKHLQPAEAGRVVSGEADKLKPGTWRHPQRQPPPSTPAQMQTTRQDSMHTTQKSRGVTRTKKSHTQSCPALTVTRYRNASAALCSS
jgi:hypothetical protein